jgi:murein endopeptidase
MAPRPTEKRPVETRPSGRADAPTAAERRLARLRRLESRIEGRESQALGTPNAGQLVDGVKLPSEGVKFFTWGPVEWARTSPPSRRHGTARLIGTILRVARQHSRANRDAPRVAVGDISRPDGGAFDARYGVVREFGVGEAGSGHVSHQNGLDVDVYYPRRDGRERAPDSLDDIDFELAQALVDRFVAAGAQFVFVGPRTPITGPAGVVQPLVRHDDHLHVRLPPD